ncbi:MAG: hypothetical protein J6B75_01630 [Ruminococcus sp.]|nr:hypothetical protein [Ruminococcus sp.]
MSDKIFKRLLLICTAAGCIATVLLIMITTILYKDCSIISYIANGR